MATAFDFQQAFVSEKTQLLLEKFVVLNTVDWMTQ